MKILGRINEKYAIASVAHYDYREYGGMMVDGGQPLTHDYAGYNHVGGEGMTTWFEVPQTFAELYEDYQFNSKKRKYGVWDIEDVRILPKDQWPDTESKELLYENAIWGTIGKNGDEKLHYVLLKDCSKGHLKAILDTQRVGEHMKEAIEYWLKYES